MNTHGASMGRLQTLKSSMLEAASGLGPFMAQTRGNVAMMFALVMPILILVTVGGVDIHRAATVRANLQDALDAASLAAARSTFTTDEDLTRVGLAALKANLKAYPQIALREGDVTFSLNDDSVIVSNATVDVDAIVANIVLPPYGQFLDKTIPVSSHSEVHRASRNIEVALVLDATGSMKDNIDDLKAAANSLVGIVVQPIQEPWYSKVAIVPYSMAVNLHDYADETRGDITPGKPITGVTWSAGPVTTVTAVSRSNDRITVTAEGHGLTNGDTVTFWGSQGMTQLNGRVFTVSNVGTNTFRLVDQDSDDFSRFTGVASVGKCSRTDCRPTVTSNAHGFANDAYVRITDLGGMEPLNNRTYQVKERTTNTFQLAAVGAGAYEGGGAAWCTVEGCEFFRFINRYGSARTHRVSTCVTERTSEAFTDASPSTRLGRNYPSTANPCLPSKLYPLSSTIADIETAIDGLKATGSTGGHLGVAWGWYAVSPNFASLFGSAAGGAYDPDETIKAVVIMTDGEYNSGYCKGVISQDSTNGSGDTNSHINCNAPNDHPYVQTQQLCTNMKAAGVVVYTVGFKVIDTDNARAVVNNCATSASHVYLADSGSDLSDAFSAIGRDITRLRISR